MEKTRKENDNKQQIKWEKTEEMTINVINEFAKILNKKED